MKIILKQLKLTYFKGIRSQTIDFNSDVTNIYGRNATGKSTLMDAFLWIFFGKDSSDRKDFQIKTLDTDNKPLHKLEHEVAAVIELIHNESAVETISIRRVLKEKWTIKRGTSTQEFTGHETTYFWNDVPMKEGEYMAKVSSIINERDFKLITNTAHFNALKWQDRRDVLLQIAGEISNVDVLNAIEAGNDIAYKPLVQALTAKKSIEEFKREIVAKKKKIKDDLILIPSRIDEANRSLPEEVDYAATQKQIDGTQADINTIDGQLQDQRKKHDEHNRLIGDKIQEMQKHRARIGEIEFNERNTVADQKRKRDQVIIDKKRELTSKQDAFNKTMIDHGNATRQRTSLEKEIEDLRNEWAAESNKAIAFKDEEFCCPTCKRAFEEGQIEEKKTLLTNNFNTNKSKTLSNIAAKAETKKEELKVLEAKIFNLQESATTLKSEIEVLTNDIAELQQQHVSLCNTEEQQVTNAIAGNEEIKTLNSKITVLQQEIDAPYQQNDPALFARKKELQTELDGLNKQMATKDQRDRLLVRIEELKTTEATMAQELATLEGIEYSITQFEKAKMDELEKRVNSRFKLVQFKLFESQINGGEVPCCITLINGVPYPDANTAAKINAGLDIISTLSDHYNVYAPIFIDNRESVIDIPECNSQIINLIVSAEHKKLTVGNSVSAIATVELFL